MTSAPHSYGAAFKAWADQYVCTHGFEGDEKLAAQAGWIAAIEYMRQCGPNGKAWEKVWISQDVIMHLQGIEAQAGKLSDAINLFKRFESEARTDATGIPQEKP